MVWCGVVWCGVGWCGDVWCGVRGVVWCGVVWYGCSVTHRTDESVPAMFGAAPAVVGEQRTEALLGGGGSDADQRQYQHHSFSIHRAIATVDSMPGQRSADKLRPSRYQVGSPQHWTGDPSPPVITDYQ